MIKKIEHIGIAVENPEKSNEIFEKLFGYFQDLSAPLRAWAPKYNKTIKIQKNKKLPTNR